MHQALADSGTVRGEGKEREREKKNAHCKQSPAIAMVLKGLTGSHMIVIKRRAGQKRKQGGNATNQQSSSVSECQSIAFFNQFLIILHFKV